MGFNSAFKWLIASLLLTATVSLIGRDV